jgi:hypothetical protein
MYVQGVSTRKVAAITEKLWIVHPGFCKFPAQLGGDRA